MRARRSAIKKRVAVGVSSACALSLLVAIAQTSQAQETPLPEDLVVDVRIFEARSINPDYRAMHDLRFFIATNGVDVTSDQWLATVARRVPDAYLAALAFETVKPDGGMARVSWEKGLRRFEASVDLTRYRKDGEFPATTRVRTLRGDEVLVDIDQEVELQFDRTSAWSHEDLEIKASDYVSHFRDFADREDRGRLYEELRSHTIFLVMTATPRLEEADERETPLTVRLPEEASLSQLQSPLGIPIQGKIQVSFRVDSQGVPLNPQIRLSTVPEANPRFLGELSRLRFPDASGKWAELEVELFLSR